MPNKGTGGAIYAGSAIDHATKYVTMTFLKKKSEWYLRYESIIRWLKNMTGKKHKIWRSDGAKEFEVSEKIKEIHDKEGIQHSITPPYSPNKNPSERFWRTLIEAIAAILITAGMSTTWWVEVAKYVVYIYNRTPEKSTGKTPFEKFFGRKHHEVKLHTWGCLMYVHVETRSKRDINKARPAMYIGIDPSGRWLGIYLDTKELAVTDSATFVENIFPLGKHKKLMGYDVATILKHLEQEQLDITQELKTQQQNSIDKQVLIKETLNNDNVDNATLPQKAKNMYSPRIPSVKVGDQSNSHKNIPVKNMYLPRIPSFKVGDQSNSTKSAAGPVTNEIKDLLKILQPHVPGTAQPIKNQENQKPDSITGIIKPDSITDDNNDHEVDTDTTVEEETTDDEQTQGDQEEQQPEEKENNTEDDFAKRMSEKFKIPKLQTQEEVNEEVRRNLETKTPTTSYEENKPKRRKYEHDQKEEAHQEQQTTRRYPSRARKTTGSDPKILEQLAQTPKKRKPYIRAYRKDLEDFALSIMKGNQDLDKMFRKTPQSVEEAKKLAEWPQWKKAIETEIEAIKRTGSMEQITNPPPGIKPIRCRWVFKIKPANEQEPERFKARLVAKGFTQKFGVDYQETFAAVAKMTSLRILIALAAINNSRLTKLDVSNAFLESEIDRDVYIYPPEGFPPGVIFKL